jgi:hypothetical protein
MRNLGITVCAGGDFLITDIDSFKPHSVGRESMSVDKSGAESPTMKSIARGVEMNLNRSCGIAEGKHIATHA